MYGSYPKSLRFDPTNNDASLATAINLNAATGVKSTWSIKEPITVTRFGIQVTTAMTYNTATNLMVIKLKKYVTFGSATGAVELASIIVPDVDRAVGKTLYVDVNNLIGVADIKTGEQLVAEVTTAGTGGGSIAGAYQPFFHGHPRAEVAGNQPYMVNLTA